MVKQFVLCALGCTHVVLCQVGYIIPTELPMPGFPAASPAQTNALWPSGLQPPRLSAWPQQISASGTAVYLPCWNVQTLYDHISCSRLFKYQGSVNQPSCKSLCVQEPRCPMWQYTTQGECWMGYGTQCQFLNQTIPQGAIGDGQRLQHGNVRVIMNITGFQVLKLYNLGIPANCKGSQCVERCRNWCYSDIGCQYWQYANGGCYVDAPYWTLPDQVQYPLTTSGINTTSNIARTLVAGEYIQHYCAPQQTSLTTTPPPPGSSFTIPPTAMTTRALNISGFAGGSAGSAGSGNSSSGSSGSGGLGLAAMSGSGTSGASGASGDSGTSSGSGGSGDSGTSAGSGDSGTSSAGSGNSGTSSGGSGDSGTSSAGSGNSGTSSGGSGDSGTSSAGSGDSGSGDSQPSGSGDSGDSGPSSGSSSGNSSGFPLWLWLLLGGLLLSLAIIAGIIACCCWKKPKRKKPRRMPAPIQDDPEQVPLIAPQPVEETRDIAPPLVSPQPQTYAQAPPVQQTCVAPQFYTLPPRTVVMQDQWGQVVHVPAPVSPQHTTVMTPISPPQTTVMAPVVPIPYQRSVPYAVPTTMQPYP